MNFKSKALVIGFSMIIVLCGYLFVSDLNAASCCDSDCCCEPSPYAKLVSYGCVCQGDELLAAFCEYEPLE